MVFCLRYIYFIYGKYIVEARACRTIFSLLNLSSSLRFRIKQKRKESWMKWEYSFWCVCFDSMVDRVSICYCLRRQNAWSKGLRSDLLIVSFSFRLPVEFSAVWVELCVFSSKNSNLSKFHVKSDLSIFHVKSNLKIFHVKSNLGIFFTKNLNV